MISSSVTAMVVFDLIVIGIIVVILVSSWYFGLFRGGHFPNSGRFLILCGVGLTGAFYAADLFTMTLLPQILGEERVAAVNQRLHLDGRWLVSIASLLLIGIGVVMGAYHRQRAEREFQKTDAMIAKAQERIVESEMRVRAVTEQTTDAIYCFQFDPPLDIGLSVEEQIVRSHDAVLIDYNHVFAASISDEFARSLKNLRFGELDSAVDVESHARFFGDFVKSGYRLVDYELAYVDRNGEPCAMQISLSGVVKQGALRRMWGTGRNVIEHTKTKAHLAARLQFQQIVAEMSSGLLKASESDSGETLSQALEMAGRYVRADRAQIVCYNEDRTAVRYRFSWSSDYGPTSTKLSPNNFPKIWHKILRGDPFVISGADDLAEYAPKDADSLMRMGFKSSIFVPLVGAGQVVGTCIFSNYDAPASWDEKEISDLRLLVDLMAYKVVQIEAQQSLNQAMSELQSAKSRLEVENRQLRKDIVSAHGFKDIVGESKSLMRCLHQVEQVAKTSTPVLLQGETGTGKELLAQAIHDRSDRRADPMIKVNCAALPANLIESELFGHEKGAFTGAVAQKPGRFEMADGGTLFLDELADLPLDSQSKLLRALQSGEFERLGGEETLTVDVRLIAATNRNLAEAVSDGEFRPDLYYRVAAFPITLPPLRDRDGDIPLLAEYFVRQHATKIGKEIDAISGSMLDQLGRYDWPGNVRELEGVIQRALITATDPLLRLSEPLRHRDADPDQVSVLSADLRSVEREHITRVLEQNDWVVGGETGAATQLGLPASTLRSRMKKLGIGRPY